MSLDLFTYCGKIDGRDCYAYNGLWRSLVAHLTGGQGVAGSNPVNPTRVLPAQTGFSVWAVFYAGVPDHNLTII